MEYLDKNNKDLLTRITIYCMFLISFSGYFFIAYFIESIPCPKWISSIDKNVISNIKVFDVYEGSNIPENQKSVAISVTIQSLEKTLTDNDLEKINNLIIEKVENKTGAKIRS